MKKWLLVLSVLAFSSVTYAQKIKVRKVKGNQAIVEFSGGNLRPGNVYELAPDELTEISEQNSARNKLVAVNFNFSNNKSDVANAENQTDLTLMAKYGWNYGTYEIGPLVTFTAITIGGNTVSTYQFGAFADYNMIDNTPGEAFVYGVGGTGSFGQRDSGDGAKINVMNFFVGPFVKWFPYSTGVGFRIDGGYEYERISGSIGGDATITGLSFTGGIIAYF